MSPKSHPVSQLEFDVIIGADGRRNTLPGKSPPKHANTMLAFSFVQIGSDSSLGHRPLKPSPTRIYESPENQAHQKVVLKICEHFTPSAESGGGLTHCV